jgi:hypothetical protein
LKQDCRTDPEGIRPAGCHEGTIAPVIPEKWGEMPWLQGLENRKKLPEALIKNLKNFLRTS